MSNRLRLSVANLGQANGQRTSDDADDLTIDSQEILPGTAGGAMTEPGMEAVSGVIDAIYSAGYDDRMWPEAMEAIRVLFSASGACVGKPGTEIGLGDVMAAESDPSFGLAYVDHYAPHNVLWNAAEALPPGSIYGQGVPLPTQTVRRSMFWNEWMAPQDYHTTLGCTIQTNAGTKWVFDVERGARQRAFDQADINLMKIIARSMQNALSLRQRLAADRIGKSHALAALDALSVGALVLDSSGRLQHINEMASILVASESAIFTAAHGKIGIRPPDIRRQWNALLAEACAPGIRGSGFLWLRSDDQQEGAISAHIGPFMSDCHGGDRPSDRLALILLKPLQQKNHLADQLSALFGLTPTEAKIANALADGMQAGEIAEQFDVKISTVRTHISNILAKSGARQQNDFLVMIRRVELPVPVADKTVAKAIGALPGRAKSGNTGCMREIQNSVHRVPRISSQ